MTSPYTTHGVPPHPIFGRFAIPEPTPESLTDERASTGLDRSREVPAVTGALMVPAKASFVAVGGFDQGYVIGDYEDSDLCLKLREIGGTACCRPAVELYHFERQSMADRGEELMMNPAFQDGRNAR